jgi:hypothetical protein
MLQYQYSFHCLFNDALLAAFFIKRVITNYVIFINVCLE